MKYLVLFKENIGKILALSTLYCNISPLPLILIVFTALDPTTLGNSTISLYGPEPATTFATTGPQIPQARAFLNPVKLVKFVAEAGAPALIV
ncbi:hypothetical protein D3C72_747010 [compost metagenome]